MAGNRGIWRMYTQPNKPMKHLPSFPTCRRPILAAFVTVAICAPSAALAQADAPAARPAARGQQMIRVLSPEVAPDRAVTFRILAPKAEAVILSGSDIPGLGRGKDMTKGTNGVWEVTLASVDPGTYRYNFSVDGLSVIDPRNPKTSESNGNTWSLVYVPGAEFMDVREVPHGAVASVTYHSKALGKVRRLHVYTPPGYERGEGQYPVFYLLHGASDSDNSWSTVGCAGFILDNLIVAGKAKPMIVVMPAGHTTAFGFGAAPARTGEDEFTRDFVTDIMPLVENRYRVRTDRNSRAIAGLSMGGAQTLNIVVPRLEKFGYFGVFSSGVFAMRGNESAPTWEERNKEHLENAKLKDGLKLAWFSTGKDDFLIETSRRTVETLKKYGFPVKYEESAGGHTWVNWRNYLNEFAPLLFQ